MISSSWMETMEKLLLTNSIQYLGLHPQYSFYVIIETKKLKIFY